MLRPLWFSQHPIEAVQWFELDIIDLAEICENIMNNTLDIEVILDIEWKDLCDNILNQLWNERYIEIHEINTIKKEVYEKANSLILRWWEYIFTFLEYLYFQWYLNHNKALFDRIWAIVIRFFIRENQSYTLEITEHREKVFWEEKNYFMKAQEEIFERTEDILTIIALSRRTNLRDATKDLLDQLVTVWILTRNASLRLYDDLNDTEHTTNIVLYEALIKWTYNDCPLKNQVLWVVFRYFTLHEDNKRCRELNSLFYWKDDT